MVTSVPWSGSTPGPRDAFDPAFADHDRDVALGLRRETVYDRCVDKHENGITVRRERRSDPERKASRDKREQYRCVPHVRFPVITQSTTTVTHVE
jgi:hypothetical protein